MKASVVTSVSREEGLSSPLPRLSSRLRGEVMGGRGDGGEIAEGGGSERGVGPKAVELIRGVFLPPASRLAEAGGDLVEGAALGLRDLEVGEDEEAQQEHCEDDEHVGATQVLQGGQGTCHTSAVSHTHKIGRAHV